MSTERITVKDLEGVVRRINRVVNGSELEPWTRDADNHMTATIGCYYLDGAYGGYALYRMVTDGGGVTDVLGGHQTKRDLYYRLHAFLEGIEAVAELTEA